MVEAPAAPSIEVDARALVKVLVHLARNAIDHTCEGGKVKIIAKLYPTHIGIHIADTGTPARGRQLGRRFPSTQAPT